MAKRSVAAGRIVKKKSGTGMKTVWRPGKKRN